MPEISKDREEAARRLRHPTIRGKPRGRQAAASPPSRVQVSFERDLLGAKQPLPEWLSRLLRGREAEDQVIAKLFTRIRRTPSRETAVLLGRVINELGRRAGAASRVRAAVRSHLKRN